MTSRDARLFLAGVAVGMLATVFWVTFKLGAFW